MARKKVQQASVEAPGPKTQKKKGSAVSARSAGSKDSAGIKAFIHYLKEVKVEFTKVTWPTKKETIGITIAVLAITFFFASYLGLVDFGLTQVLSLLY